MAHPASPLLIGLVLSALLAGCGGESAGAPGETTSFSATDAVLFDDGVDFISSALSLEGRWQQEWHQDLIDRVAAADVIALVSIRTLRTDTDPQGRVTHRLFAEPQRILRGELNEDEVALATRQDSRGFRTVHGRMDRIEERGFLAFLKWYTDENGEIGVHWHLSPDSEEVVAAASRIMKEGGADGPQSSVTVHTQND